ncbi:hypothetical protein B0H66DRAFT_602162 [Apodospora peruviana]|uniref:AB hydrolase-1 domain-containing protein n=1 Tax=Apodospora peruviana TaxID=516989 RepID=A0AAE0ICQ3_9PEZI|nr:hypothetical protein B0H66DRAFT_602162 [Apodospora peruviana]
MSRFGGGRLRRTWNSLRRRSHDDPDITSDGDTAAAGGDDNDERLRVICNPEDCKVDIIAVHGLGKSFGDWTTQTKDGAPGGLWLETLLPKSAAGARIMTYCYNAEALSPQVLVRKILYSLALDLVHRVKQRREGEPAKSRRPVIFVAHSLGGLVVQRALVIASESSDVSLQDVELSTAGLLFFGTPSTSLSADGLADAIIKIARFSTSKRRRLHASEEGAIREDAAWFLSEMEAFKPIESRIETESFIEAVKTTFRTNSSRSSLIVGATTAAFPGTNSYRLQARHTSLVKFDGPDDPGYQRFVDALSAMIKAAQTRVAEKWLVHDNAERLLSGGHRAYMESGFGIESWVPDGVPLMGSRQHIAHGLEQTVDECSRKGDLTIVIAHGDKGAGKTTVARHYALNVLERIRSGRSERDFVFWINAESRDTVVASFLELARRIEDYYWTQLEDSKAGLDLDRPKDRAQLCEDLGFPAVEKMLAVTDAKDLDSIEVKSAVKAVKNWLLRKGNRWLLVYDNVTGAFDLMEFLPLHTHGHTIIIPADKDRCPWGRVEYKIQGMSEKEALTELVPPEEQLKSMPWKVCNEIRELALSIVSRIDYHSSQQISLIAAHLRSNPTVAHYRQYLEALNKDLRYTMRWSAFTQSQQALVKQILSVVSLLSPSDMIPREVFSVIPDVYRHNSKPVDRLRLDSESISTALAILVDEKVVMTPAKKDDAAAMEKTEPPAAYYYLLPKPGGSWVPSSDLWATKDEEEEAQRMTCRSLVSAVKRHQKTLSNGGVVQDNLIETQAFSRLLLPHARKCSAFIAVIEKQYHHNNHAETTGDDDDGDWQVLGDLCRAHGDSESAIHWFKLALSITAGSSGCPRHLRPEERTRVSLDLAAVYLERKDTSACRSVLSDMRIAGVVRAHFDLDFRFRLLGAAERVVEGRIDLAQGEFAALVEKSEKENSTQREERSSRDREGQANTNRTILAVHKLAASLKAGGKLEEARAYYRRAFQGYRFALGQYHPVTLDVGEEYADLLHLQGSFPAAEEIVTECIRAKEAMLGREHISTITSIAKRATLLDLQSRFDEADEGYAVALVGMTHCLGRTHALTVATLENKALSYRMRARQYEKAKKERALDEAVTLYGEVIRRKKEGGFETRDIRSSVDRLSDMTQKEAYLRNKLP